MLNTIFSSSLSEMAFYMVMGGVIGSMLTILCGLCFRNQILRKLVEQRIPEITEEYKVYEAGAELVIKHQQEDIDRYRRIQAEATLHASNVVKAIGSR